MSVEVPCGGQWEVVKHAYNDNLNGGYTALWSADGNKYRRLRFFLGFSSQSLYLKALAASMFSGAINYQKADTAGTGTYHHPNRVSNNTHLMFGRGTGYLQGWAMPRRDASESGWLLNFRGFWAAGTNWNDAAGEAWNFAGRVYFWRNPPVLNDWTFEVGFSSAANEAGAYQLLVEGQRDV